MDNKIVKTSLYSEICEIIDKARRCVATYANMEVCMMNWNVGRRIKEDILSNRRAAYGRKVYENLSAALHDRYGTGWGVEKLKQCVRAAYIKLGRFKPSYEGQMRLYLRYLNRIERKEWEEEPIGLILRSEGNTEHIQYFMMDEQSDIRVAQYYTQLPDKEILVNRLQRAIAIAREHQMEAKLNTDKSETPEIADRYER